jgi:phenylalanyl-tRNA synthetase alpha chain
VPTRFRPGYYPFTEPSVAFDIRCLVCGGSGCPACKRSGWMTILGAGMVHPTVITNGGYDPREYQGYAIGFGPDRMTLLRHGIGDIRLLWGADVRFLAQFAQGR